MTSYVILVGNSIRHETVQKKKKIAHLKTKGVVADIVNHHAAHHLQRVVCGGPDITHPRL